MPQSTLDAPPTAPVTDDVLVEAPTAEQALAEVNARLGPDASIVEASKVLRGGVGGFFAREVVQLRARGHDPDQPAAPTAVEPPHTTTTGDETGLERLLAGITSDVDAAERSFGDVLRRQLADDGPDLPGGPPLSRAAVRSADDPVARAAQPPPAPEPMPAEAAAQAAPAAPVEAVAPAEAPAPVEAVAPVEAPAPVDAPGTPVWSTENLRRLGLPSTLVDAVAAGAPADDAAWVEGLARAIAPLCRRLPDGPMVVAGASALPVAEALGLPVVAAGCRTPAVGSFAVRGCDTPDKMAWIAASMRTRWLHVVVGGPGWRQLLFAGPAAVSWVARESLPEALQVATDLGLALAYGMDGDAAGIPAPANPVDVAITIRSLLPRR